MSWMMTKEDSAFCFFTISLCFRYSAAQQFAGDATDDYLHNFTDVDWWDKLITNVTWSVDRWSSILQ